MTTTLTRPVRRRITTERGTLLTVSLTLTGIAFREHGRRTELVLPYGSAFLRAAEVATGANVAPRRRRSRRA